MTNVDEVTKNAMSEQEAEIVSSIEELGYFALGLSLFRGKLAWVTWVIMLVQGAMFVAGVWCAVHLFAATDSLEALKWGLSAVVLILMAGQMKMSYMPQLQAERVLRELKRIELLALNQGKG